MTTLIYLVDSLEIENISRTKYCFDLIIKCLDMYSPETQIFLFQHKTDLIPKRMRAEVRETIQKYMMEGTGSETNRKKLCYLETSMFERSIVEAIDNVMRLTLDGIDPNNKNLVSFQNSMHDLY